MPGDDGVQVVLNLLPGEPIGGRIQLAGGEAEPFHGWIELASRLEAVRQEITDGGPAEGEDLAPSS